MRHSAFAYLAMLALLAVPALGGHGGHGGHGGYGAAPVRTQHVARQHTQQSQHRAKGHQNRRVQHEVRAAHPMRTHRQVVAKHDHVRVAHVRATQRPVAVQGQRHAVRGQREERLLGNERRVFPRRGWVASDTVADRAVRGRGRSLAGRERFRGLDVDGNRVISRAEWRGNNRSFANHDWNRDGILSGVEVVPGGLRTSRMTRVERVPFLERFLPLPRRLVAPVPLGLPLPLPAPDLGVLPLPPLPSLAVAFPMRLDEERLEGLVKVQGFAPVDLVVRGPSVVPLDRVLLTDRFLALDVNRDHFVTLREWDGPRPLFWRLDRDRDRRLVVGDFFVGPSYAPLRSAMWVDRDRFVGFDLIDVSDDGIIAPWEWSGSMDLFFLLDRNGDGLLERWEYLGLGPRRVVPLRLVVNGALDLDHDGCVSRWEWVGDPFRFVSLDLNGDGRIRRVEAMVGTVL